MLLILRNELYKLFHSRRIYIFSAILFVILLGFTVIVNSVSASQYITQEMIDGMKGANFPVQFLSTVSDLLLPIFVVLIITFLVADEYENGTLKLPILHGFKRSPVIKAKLLISIFFGIYMLLLIYCTTNLISVGMWGIRMYTTEALLHVTKVFLLSVFPIAALIAFTIFLSLMLKNSGVITGIIIAVLVFSSLLGSVFPEASKYMFTHYFKAFIQMPDRYLTGIVVCLVSTIIFLLLSFYKFSKMEIQK